MLFYFNTSAVIEKNSNSIKQAFDIHNNPEFFKSPKYSQTITVKRYDFSLFGRLLFFEMVDAFKRANRGGPFGLNLDLLANPCAPHA